MFSVKDVSFYFGQHLVLDKISFVLPPDVKMITLIGPNGAGKTTLLKLLAGLLVPSTGEVSRPHGRMGYMPGVLDPRVRIPLHVKDFLRFAYRPLISIDDLLEKFSLAPSFLDKPLLSLSLGERQKVLWMRMLMGDPDVLLLDEPFSSVDERTEAFLYRQLDHLLAQGKTILMTSHDLHTVFERSDFVLFLDQRLCCTGRPEQVKKSAAYKIFFGSAPLRPFRHHH